MVYLADRTIAAPRADGRIWLPLVWAIAIVALAVSSGLNSLSTDDAMRLVEVRDFLAGQSWFDVTQVRLDPPAGVEMHWSRLIDLPLGTMIKLFSLFTTKAMAEQFTLAIWPSALLLLFLAGVWRLTDELAGPAAARIATIFAVLMAPVLQHFRTGAIDHHNVQLTLLIWSLAYFARRRRDGHDSALAGGLCGLSVALGAEMTPAIAVLAAIVSLRWIVEGDVCRRDTLQFCLAFAGGTFILGATTIPPGKYLTVDCDAISFVQIGVAAVGGLGLAALAAIPQPSIIVRLCGAAALTVLTAVFVYVAAPECLGDPYGRLDPRLIALWLSVVNEGRNLASLTRDLPQQVPAYFGVPLAALLLGAFRCVRQSGPQRWTWLACVATEAVLVVLAAWELRFAAGAGALGAVLLPAALLQMSGNASPLYLGVPRAPLLALLILNPAALLALGAGAARAFDVPAVKTLAEGGGRESCQRPADYAPLASLAAGRVLAFIDAGPFVLMESPHAILAAPYHRNTGGNIAMLDIFLARPKDAGKMLRAREISYVAFCPGAPERFNYAAAAPDGFAAVLADNKTPDFLRRIPLTGTPLAVYRVLGTKS